MIDLLSILSIVLIISSLCVFGIRNYKIATYVYAFQTFILVMIFLFLYITYDAEQLGGWAIIAFFTKVIFVPFILLRLIKKLKVEHEDEPLLGFFISPVVAIAFSLAIAMAIYPIYLKFSLIQEHIPLIASITIFMIGIFGFILRNSAIKQILAYCTFENGIHLSLALMAYNSPEIAELGILTDAIFAVLIMAILSQRFFKYFGSLDVSKADELKG
ncbi:hydantoin racemase [Malaciobacter molluscorum LMG 25693]|uniref:Hydantoin racemase n=1 Tax=Malaciobacter molluscorum LMG 25693 TaxID=870501 RepID=A0A2G1DL79_9BACT|nr:hydrogenase 4 membrane subunit [Malaciobacter molluscorum]AXX91987.1 hydrogenase-4, antiporter-like subunit [Malaciobacter molluscorum LMG 25693]PHO19220.1 hydantoin racemase [Malaciobacter molluscorum LMG 25693]